jgi:hypothetical protein
MTRSILFSTVIALTTIACDKDAPPTEAPGDESSAPMAAAVPDAEPEAATQPEREMLIVHIEGHIEYPADRATILKACADTDEFTEGEKRWVAESLAEGEYADAAAVISALGL